MNLRFASAATLLLICLTSSMIFQRCLLTPTQVTAAPQQQTPFIPRPESNLPPPKAGFGVAGMMGFQIEAVTPNSPAAQAGLQTGDVIRSVDGLEFWSASDFRRLLAEKNPGHQLKLGVVRHHPATGKPVRREVSVTLSELKQ